MEQDNVYAGPQSDVRLKSNNTSVMRLYTPTQVACGTLGGPVGLIYFLAANFGTLGKQELKQKTIIFGTVLLLALVLVLPLLPESFPGTPFTVAYILIAQQVASRYQMTKAQILESADYDVHSNWRVLGFGILCLIGSALAIFIPLMLLISTGIWQPD